MFEKTWKIVISFYIIRIDANIIVAKFIVGRGNNLEAKIWKDATTALLIDTR